MNRPLCFVVNQSLLDGSAHALYCVRHCWSLAESRPDCAVELIFPGQEPAEKILAYFGLPPLPNFSIRGLLAMRKHKGARGVTLNAVYHFSLLLHFRQALPEKGILATASFPRLFGFLLGRSRLRSRVRAVYEVHQLESLEPDAEPSKVDFETGVLQRCDVLITTTHSLAQVLEKEFPEKPVHNAGLACGFNPRSVPPPRPRSGALRLAYIGSLYREQGVDWLVENWSFLEDGQSLPLQLEIIGGSEAEITRLKEKCRQLAIATVTFRGRVPPADLPEAVREIDALIIPALAEGRMAYVALTKAYDYLALGRPIVASALPTIAEVITETEGFLFEPGNRAACKRALMELIMDPEEASRRATTAAAHGQELTWNARAQRWWNAVLQNKQQIPA